MKYTANPVSVDAQEIVSAGPLFKDGTQHLALRNGENFTATPGMTARMTAVAGDFVVTQEDGYVYLNPKDVFLRKYSPAVENYADTVIDKHGVVHGKPLPDLRGIRT